MIQLIKNGNRFRPKIGDVFELSISNGDTVYGLIVDTKNWIAWGGEFHTLAYLFQPGVNPLEHERPHTLLLCDPLVIIRNFWWHGYAKRIGTLDPVEMSHKTFSKHCFHVRRGGSLHPETGEAHYGEYLDEQGTPYSEPFHPCSIAWLTTSDGIEADINKHYEGLPDS